MTGVTVFLECDQRDEALSWARWNAHWLSEGGHQLVVSHATGQSEQRSLSVMVGDVGRAARDGVAEWAPIGEDDLDSLPGRRDRALVLATAAAAIRPGWHAAIAKAQAARPFAAATGRWILPKPVPSNGLGEPFVDHMPKMLKSKVREWSFSPAFHGCVVHNIPPGFLWLTPQVNALFLAAHRKSDTLATAQALLFSLLASEPELISVYLPSVHVYDVKAVG